MSDAPDGAPFEMECLELVLLRRPAALVELPDDEVARYQALHLAHLGAMEDAGHLVVAGPFDHQQDEALRGMCLYRTGSVQRARELAEADPAVVNGRLEVEAMAWWCRKGAVSAPPADR